MTSRPSPKPWKVHKGYNKAGFPFFEIRDKENFIVMSIRGGSIPTEQDAKDMVDAVNLVAELKEKFPGLMDGTTDVNGGDLVDFLELGA